MVIAFTVGHEFNYDQYLSENNKVEKLGRTTDYKGGAVWKTAQEAFNFINSSESLARQFPKGKFAVYEVDLPNSWEECTEDNKEYSYLLINSRIIKKVR